VKGRSTTKLEVPAVVSIDIVFLSGFRCHSPHLNQRPNTYHAVIITFIIPCVFYMSHVLYYKPCNHDFGHSYIWQCRLCHKVCCFLAPCLHCCCLWSTYFQNIQRSMEAFFKHIIILFILISDFECLCKSSSYKLYPKDKVEDFLLQFIFLEVP